MKRLLYLLISTILLSSGCKKFLVENSQDEIRPSTVQDLNSIMSAQGYPYQTNLNLVVDMLSDDVQCNGGQGDPNYQLQSRKGKSPFSWSKQMFEELLLPGGIDNKTYLDSWTTIYKNIMGCNVVLDEIETVSGSAADKANLKGQALAMRGYYYFMLVNMFGKPYNDPGAPVGKSPGVPLKLTMAVTDALLVRNTVAEVYQQIESDLKQAADLMKAYPQSNTSVYKMNEAAAYALLSRVYLYEEKWDLVIEYANIGLAIKSGLTQFNSFVGDGGYYTYNSEFSGNKLNRMYDATKSKEILWAYYPVQSPSGPSEWFVNGMIPNYSVTFKPVYAPSSSLLALYDSRPFEDNAIYLGDLRARLYFQYSAYFTPTFSYEFANYAGGMGGAGIRVAELYLNRAEANLHNAISSGNDAFRLAALNDINTLRISRYDTRQAYVPINITNSSDLMDFYKDERRREFPFEEGHRWFDLRRYGMPSITHDYEEVAGTGQTFTLSKNDSRYTLPIPQAVMVLNGKLIQNP